MTTKITPSVLENTTVVAATHGTAAAVPVIVVDPQGRITGVTNTSISIGTSQIGSGTLDDARLPAQETLTAANYYGDAAKTVAIVTDAKGRIKSAANVTIAIASSAVTGLATSATTDTTNADNIGSGTLNAARLADSGVVARTYGTASSVSQVVVDAKGRITGISNVAIQIATSQITNYPTFAASATTDTTNAGNIGSGTLLDDRLSNAGTRTGTFGSASAIPKITVDSKGRVTSVTATDILIGAGAVTGLATVATSGAYLDLSGRPAIGTSDNVRFNSLGIGTASSGTTGEIRATNNITAYYSDDRLKTKLGVIENALDKIEALSGFYYEENELAESLGYKKHRQIGVSAQQVQNQLPDCGVVVPAPIDEEYLTVRYEKLIPLLIEGIKELRAEVKEIKNSI
jgi:hypothetical protein